MSPPLHPFFLFFSFQQAHDTATKDKADRPTIRKPNNKNKQTNIDNKYDGRRRLQDMQVEERKMREMKNINQLLCFFFLFGVFSWGREQSGQYGSLVQ